MQIVGYLQTSLIEWPGKIASVIFVPGCNFRCPFCHNSNLVDPKKIAELPFISEKKVLADLKKRKKWIDGVCLTGGEPTLQSDLDKFLGECRQLGFETLLETNGSLFPILQCMLQKELIDFIAMDYKTTFENYGGVVKTKNQKLKKGKETGLAKNIKKSIELLLSSEIPFELRTTVVPGIHDEKVLVEMARELRELTERPRDQETKKLKNRKTKKLKKKRTKELKWVLQNFQPKNCLDPEFEKKKPYDIKKLEGFLRVVKKYVPGVELRGI